jgi:hypothetical protein
VLQDPYRFDLYRDLGAVADAGLLAAGTSDGRDALATVSPTGLQAWSIEAAHLPTLRSQLTGNGWNAVTKLFCLRNAGGSHRILGLDPVRNALLRADYSATTGTLVHVDEKSVAPELANIQALHWLPTSMDSEYQLAVQAGDYVYLCTWDVVPFHFIYPGGAHDGVAVQIAASRGAGPDPADLDMLCIYSWVFDMFRFTAVNSEHAAVYDLGQRQLGRPVPIDRADGYQDLGFPSLQGAEVLRLRRQPGAGSPFHQVTAGLRYGLVTGSIAPPAPPSAIAFCDLDVDGDADLFTCQSAVVPDPEGGDPFVWNATQTFLDATSNVQRPGVSAPTGTSQGQAANLLAGTLRVTIPPALAGCVPLVGESFKYRVEAWVQPDQDGPLVLAELLRIADHPVSWGTSFTQVPYSYAAFHDLSPIAINPARYVLQMQVSLVRTMQGVPGETVYPSTLFFLAGNTDHIHEIRTEVMIRMFGEAAQSSGPGDGDGTVGTQTKPPSGGGSTP